MSEVRLRWYSGKPAGAALPFGAAVRIDPAPDRAETGIAAGRRERLAAHAAAALL